MAAKKLKAINAQGVTLFKIMNRRGYAALCRGNLTEGRTPYQAYMRMNKAVKRQGYVLKPITSAQAIRLVRSKVC